MLVLQAMQGLSLEQTEYLVSDRLSWMRFCGLGPGDAVPDASTLWDFPEALIAAGAIEALFTRLDRAITAAGYLPMSGQIVDATLVAAPRQRNTEAEKAAIKAGKTAAEIWPEKPAKARQKDRHGRGRARWRRERSGNTPCRHPRAGASSTGGSRSCPSRSAQCRRARSAAGHPGAGTPKGPGNGFQSLDEQPVEGAGGVAVEHLAVVDVARDCRHAQ